MRGSLKGILARVERMNAGFQQGDCGKGHTRHRLSMVWYGQEVPPWPEPDTPRNCEVCGQPFVFRHLVDQLGEAPGVVSHPPADFVPRSTICTAPGFWPAGYPGERGEIHAW
jgi:hypothetical protein